MGNYPQFAAFLKKDTHKSPDSVAEYEELRELIQHAKSMRRLRDLIRRGQDQLATMRAAYGLKALPEQLRAFREEAKRVAEGEVVWARKALLSALLSAYDGHSWPAHAQFMIDPHGKQPRWPRLEIRLLEATLYEDMCVLFNLLLRTQQAIDRQEPNKITRKTVDALCRATLTSAYYFVESYINGVAMRYLATHGPTLDQESRDVLTEWDSRNQRPKPLPMREKILKFTKIARGSAHPPIQESNCPEMRILTKISKQFRDSIVHASAIPDRITRIPEKEMAVFTVTLRDAEQAVDASVGFVRKAEIAVFGSDTLLHWMKERGVDGFFPESALE